MKSRFYEIAGCLDLIKSVHIPSPEDVDTVLRFIAEAPYARYFFHHLSNPAWLKPLKDAGVFTAPPAPVETQPGYWRMPVWEASKYLARVAASADPQDIVNIAVNMDTRNISVLTNLLQAGLQLPAAHSAQLTPAVIRWLNASFYSPLPELASELLTHLTEGDQREAALQLLQAATAPASVRKAPADSILLDRVQPRLSSYTFKRMMIQRVPAVYSRWPLETVRILQARLEEGIRLEAAADSRAGGETTSWWRSAIEDHVQNLITDDFKNLVCDAIRDILKTAGSQPSICTVVRSYLTHQYDIFRRLAMYAIGISPGAYPDLVIHLLSDASLLEDAEIRHEYFCLLQRAFELAPEETRTLLLESILRGGSDKRWESIRTSQDATRLISDDEVLCWRERWTLNWLWALRDFPLPPAIRAEIDRLTTKFGPPEHPDFVRWLDTPTLKQRPTPGLSLRDLAPGEALERIRQFVPRPRWDGPSDDDLALTLSAAVQDDPSAYSDAIDGFLDPTIRPVYWYHLLRGFQEAWKLEKDFDWKAVLDFCLTVAIRVDPVPSGSPHNPWGEIGTKEVHRQITDLLRTALAREDHSLGPQYLDQARDLVSVLLNDPDPTVDEEASRMTLETMDPATLASNTVRGNAMHALVSYALCRARSIESEGGQRPQSFEAAVKELLEQKLDKARDPSVAVHSAFGEYLPHLHYLDPAWLIGHLGDIFVAGSDNEKYRRAAWPAYVCLNRLYSSLFPLLRDHYVTALDWLAQGIDDHVGFEKASDHLGQHLMTAYWLALETLDVTDSLVATFFRVAPVEARAAAIHFLSSGLQSQKPPADSDLWQRMRTLWQSRLRAASESPEPSAFRAEVAAFGTWLAYVPESLSELLSPVRDMLPYLEDVMEIRQVLVYLAEQAAAQPEPAVAILVAICQSGRFPAGLFSEETRSILSAAVGSGVGEAQTAAIEIINRLGELGDYSYRDLLKGA